MLSVEIHYLMSGPLVSSIFPFNASAKKLTKCFDFFPKTKDGRTTTP
jgi:hypothetical protein